MKIHLKMDRVYLQTSLEKSSSNPLYGDLLCGFMNHHIMSWRKIPPN